MPILNLKVSAKKNLQLTQKITELLLNLTTDILKKKREVTAIVIEYVDQDCWLIAGSSLSNLAKNSFYLTIKITDETNTKDEKAQYINAVFAGFENLLKNLHEESYIYIEDVRATSYGFGGKTQEYRYQQTSWAKYS